MVPRRDLLSAVSEELSDLSAAVAGMQASLGRILGAGADAGENGMWQMQEIDRLQQTLDDLAAILRRAAEGDGHRVEIEPLLAVARLGGLRERLGGCQTRGSPRQEAGVVTIF